VLEVQAEVDAVAREQVDRVGREDAARVIELAKVGLILDAAAGASTECRQLAARLGEGVVGLDEVQHVDVGLEGGADGPTEEDRLRGSAEVRM
jgi:hypothetical protein